MKTRLHALSTVVLGLALFACTGQNTGVTPPGTTPPAERPEGQSEFLTPTQGQNAFGGRAETDAAAGGAPAAGAAPSAMTPTNTQSTVPREIEESDIYKLVGNHLFVLNRYRGLQILDISDLDNPRVIGKAPIFGYPKEMYVRGTNAYVIVSDYYTFWRDATATADAAPYGFYGSELRIIDVSDVTNPRVTGGIRLAGDCSDSRIVGDVMYLVSSRYAYWSRFDSTDNVDKTQILSLSVANPENVRVIDSKDFPRNGWEHHISVTPRTIYLASSGYNGNTWPNSYTTNVKYIDISDPRGNIRVRGGAPIPGMVRDRWSMDEHEGVLRVASGTAWGNGDVYLTTVDVTNPDVLTQLGQSVLHVNENLTSARFDGTRGYLVTYRNIDPLWIYDLSDARNPRVRGELEMTGWLDFMVPMGDRIVALGHEDTTTNGQRDIRLAVSLIDVSNMDRPRLLSRVALDGLWGWVPGDRDDFAKVFKVLGEQNLVVFPFQAWSRNEYKYVGGVQLIDVFRDTMARRGLIQNAGWVERGIPHGENTVLTLSSEVFQIMDITNRDQPRLRGRLELARNVQDFGLVGNYTVQLSGDWYRGDTSVVITPKSDPDTATPVSALHVPAPYGRLFLHGNMAYIASLREIRDAAGDATGNSTIVQVVDLSNPLAPRVRGTVTLPEQVWLGYRYWYWGSGDEVVQSGSTLAFHKYQYPYYYYDDCLGCGVPRGAETTRAEHKIHLVDLANADTPRVASTITLDSPDWSWGLRASGDNLYLSEYRTIRNNDRWYSRYALRKIGIADPASPVVGRPINIPGIFVDASADGRYLYTLENYWDATGAQDRYYGQNRTLFHTLALVDNTAYLRSSVRLEGYVNNVIVRGQAGYTSTQRYEDVIVNGQSQGGRSITTLVTLDLANPRATRVAGRTDIPQDYAYLQKVDGGRAFLGSGAGIFSYLVGNLERPQFEEFYRTQGWAQDIVVDGQKAFVPSGYYGVQVLELGAGGPTR